jgi:hypothetical protein
MFAPKNFIPNSVSIYTLKMSVQQADKNTRTIKIKIQRYVKTELKLNSMV